MPIPFPPMSPVPLPPISMPAAPDWWKTVGEFLQNYANNIAGADSTGGGGNDRSACYDRWEKEFERCGMFGRVQRNRQACESRAQNRRNLCYANGGMPDPNEPPEYWWNDIPNDPAGR